VLRRSDARAPLRSNCRRLEIMVAAMSARQQIFEHGEAQLRMESG
jgi:hypothetical protein